MCTSYIVHIILIIRFHVHIWNKNRKLITIYLRLSTYIIPPSCFSPLPQLLYLNPLPLSLLNLPIPSLLLYLPSLTFCISTPSLPELHFLNFYISPTSPSVSPLPHLLYLPYLTFRISPTSPSVSPCSLNFCILPLPHSQYSTPFPLGIFPPAPPSPPPPLPTLVFSVYIQFVTQEGKEWLCNGGFNNEREI